MNTEIFKLNSEKIEAAVRAAEVQTSGQIVPVVSASSGDYSGLSYRYGALGLVLFSLGLWVLRANFPFVYEGERLLLLQACGFLFGWLLGTVPAVIRFSFGKKFLEREVHDRALAEFARLGLHHTKHKTGVLIYLSLLERRVVILADKGINEKVGETFWHDEVRTLAEGIRNRNSVDALVTVISKIGAKLEGQFPSFGDNELADNLQIR